MADETAKTEEEIKAEETVAEEKKVAEKAAIDEIVSEDEKSDDESSQETLDAIKKFDAKVASDDTDSADDDDDDDKPSKKDEAVEEEDAGEEGKKVVEETAEDKLNAAADELEKEIEAEAGKSAADKQADVDAKVKADADAKVAADEQKEAEKFSSGLPTGEGEFDEEYVKAMDQMGQGFLDRENALKADNEDLRAEIKSQANQRLNDILDRKFDALGDEFTEVLGKGETEDLELDSDEYENRGKVLTRMSLMVQLHIKTDKPIPTTSKLFTSAVSYLFKKEKNKPKTDAKTVKDLKTRHGQTVAKASNKSSASTAEEKQMQGIKDFDKKVAARR